MAKLIKFITLEEFKIILSKAKGKQTKLGMVLGFGSGLRISEMLGGKRKDGSLIPPLTKEKVDLQAHQIRIEQGKGKKDRITVTSPWLNEQNIKLLPLKLKRRTFQHRVTQLGKKWLKKEISCHTLRHGFGNYMVNEKNVPLPMVQQMMGHSRIDTTGIYTKANPKQAIEKAWEAF
jgi:integrase/recombinase XerD